MINSSPVTDPGTGGRRLPGYRLGLSSGGLRAETTPGRQVSTATQTRSESSTPGGRCSSRVPSNRPWATVSTTSRHQCDWGSTRSPSESGPASHTRVRPSKPDGGATSARTCDRCWAQPVTSPLKHTYCGGGNLGCLPVDAARYLDPGRWDTGESDVPGRQRLCRRRSVVCRLDHPLRLSAGSGRTRSAGRIARHISRSSPSRPVAGTTSPTWPTEQGGVGLERAVPDQSYGGQGG